MRRLLSAIIWKILTENESAKDAGGIYLFQNEETASSLSDLEGRSEKSHGRDQILLDLQRQ